MNRKAPTLAAKLASILPRHVCTWCGRILGTSKVHWDHVQFYCFGGPEEGWNLDPLHEACHRAKTNGTHVPLSGDISRIAKVKRVSKKEEEFRRRLLLKADGVAREPSRWPKRSLR